MWQAIAAGLAIGGGIMNALGTKRNTEQAMASMLFQSQQTDVMGLSSDFNSRQLALDANIAMMNANEQAKALRRYGHQLMGAQKTAIAKSGVLMEGSPLEVMARSAEAIELEAVNTRIQGRFQQKQLGIQSGWEAKKGQYYHGLADYQRGMVGEIKRAGTLNMITGFLGSGTQAASFFA